jgi:hypothetical protein
MKHWKWRYLFHGSNALGGPSASWENLKVRTKTFNAPRREGLPWKERSAPAGVDLSFSKFVQVHRAFCTRMVITFPTSGAQRMK